MDSFNLIEQDSRYKNIFYTDDYRVIKKVRAPSYEYRACVFEIINLIIQHKPKSIVRIYDIEVADSLIEYSYLMDKLSPLDYDEAEFIDLLWQDNGAGVPSAKNISDPLHPEEYSSRAEQLVDKNIRLKDFMSKDIFKFYNDIHSGNIMTCGGNYKIIDIEGFDTGLLLRDQSAFKQFENVIKNDATI